MRSPFFSPQAPLFPGTQFGQALHNVTLLVRSCIPLLSPIYHCADYNCMFCFTTSKSQTIHSSIQEQACYAGRLPSPSHPIGTASRKQYRRIHRPIKKSHTLKKVRLPCVARRGGARGGETAFATVSASPPRTFHCLPSRTYFKKQRKTIFSSQFLSHFYKWNPPERIPLPVTADKYWNSVRSQYQDSARNHIQPQHGLPALLQTS